MDIFWDILSYTVLHGTIWIETTKLGTSDSALYRTGVTDIWDHTYVVGRSFGFCVSYGGYYY